MKNKNTKISYDAEADVLSVENKASTPIHYAQEMDNVVVHFSRKGIPVLVEILQASDLFKRQSKVVKQSLRRVLTPAL